MRCLRTAAATTTHRVRQTTKLREWKTCVPCCTSARSAVRADNGEDDASSCRANGHTLESPHSQVARYGWASALGNGFSIIDQQGGGRWRMALLQRTFSTTVDDTMDGTMDGTANANSAQVGSLYDSWIEDVNYIRSLGVGSFTESTWLDVDNLIRTWIFAMPEFQQRRPTNEQHATQLATMMNLIFALLERTAMEPAVRLPNPPDALQGVLQTWNIVFARQCRGPRGRSSASVDGVPMPLEVFKTVDRLQQSSNGAFFVDQQVVTSILEVMSLTFKHGIIKDSRPGMEVATNLLVDITEASRHNPAIQPSLRTFAAFMNCCIHSNLPNAVDLMDEVYAQLEKMNQEGWAHLKPNDVIFNLRLKMHVVAGQLETAEALLHQHTSIQRTSDDYDGIDYGGDSDTFPDCISFTTVLDGYATPSKGRRSDPTRAQGLLSRMQQLYEGGNDLVKPNLFNYTTVIKAWALAGNSAQAESIFNLLREYSNEDPELTPDTAVHNTLLLAYARARQPEKAHALLLSMIGEDMVGSEQSQEAPHRTRVAIPDQRSFNIVIAAWAKQGKADMAEAVLTLMHDLHREGKTESKPDVVSYNAVLDAWSRSKDNDAWKRVDDILQHMLKKYRNGDKSIKPTIVTLNSVMKGFAKADNSIRAERLLDVMLNDGGSSDLPKPNLRTWNTALSSCSRLGNVNSASNILAKMQRNSVAPDIITCNTMLACLSRNGTKKAADQALKFYVSIVQNHNVEPDRISFETLLDAIIHGADVGQAEELILELCRDPSKYTRVNPNLDMFHKVLRGWVNQGSPKRAESLLLKMIELYENGQEAVKPNLNTYNRVLSCWAKSNEKYSGERAQLILRQMKMLEADGKTEMAPDIISYNTVVNAWANSMDPTSHLQIESLVLEMIMAGREKLMPDAATYGSWLKAISRHEDVKDHVKDVVKMMKVHDFSPTGYLEKRIAALSK